MNSNFFKTIFNDEDETAANRRQTKTVLAQIGIDESEDITENELEEYIIIKAIKDYNCSKFSRDQLANIEGIITDVF